ncbi:NAD(P)H-dependent flavin oxidoreductase [Bdellovibrio svalbardensis]|uniref:Propionate 3-nitronate monooxygenase n=1 Tax=Bdellovibrio svalbardensis TaxID=2972972 RepID=A0ABT6DLC8_9BACT|nr:nitronate monooxygenase [Bdellovibrio svalbardensis]MDG0815928.1 nitronate monooxygenase [Bdellovibrio svalbardensis]
MENAFTKLVGIQNPIILAPMAGGPSTPELVAAVSNAGGLGSLGGNYLSPEGLAAEIQKVKSLTSQPFAVNLFVPYEPAQPAAKETQEMLDYTNDLRRKLGLTPLEKIPPTKNNFEEQMNVVLTERPPVFSFTLGLLRTHYLRDLKNAGIKTIGTATTLEEALQLQDSGVDAITLQGFEGGGHRGVFFGHQDFEIPLFTLLESVRGRIKVPVIAAGGLMTGFDIHKSLAAGASAAQLGTAFLLCKEAGTSKCYRDALLSHSPQKHTEITDAFSGHRARGLLNQFMKEFKAKSKRPLPFPIQNTLTQDIRKKSAELGISDYCSLWAGAAFDQLNHSRNEIGAADLLHTLVGEMSP